MKNIIILGAARSGKSTLAKMLHEEYNYSIISIDSFISALCDTFPNLGITHSNTDNKFKLMPLFVFSYMSKIINEYPNQKFVLEGWHVYPNDIYEVFKKNDVKIICLGYTKISCEDSFKIIRNNEMENSYTKKMSDEKLKQLISKHIEYSKVLQEQCKEKGIKFFDTSFDRKNVLKNVMKYLMND